MPLETDRGLRSDTNDGRGLRLLVSVRDVDESRAALEGGADIIDVKEPSRGALGMADASVLHDVAQAVQALSPGTLVTAALGELREWLDGCRPKLPKQGFSYFKLGLAGVGSDDRWIDRWLRVRSEIDRRSRLSCGWIAVAYADADAAGAPGLERVVDAAEGTGCRGVLIDTYDKDQGGLFDHSRFDTLLALCRRVRGAGLTMALAGRLNGTHLPRLLALSPDVVAIRSAACLEGSRAATICSERVASFRMGLCGGVASQKFEGVRSTIPCADGDLLLSSQQQPSPARPAAGRPSST